MGGNRIVNMQMPAAPNDSANKAYVDSKFSGGGAVTDTLTSTTGNKTL